MLVEVCQNYKKPKMWCTLLLEADWCFPVSLFSSCLRDQFTCSKKKHASKYFSVSCIYPSDGSDKTGPKQAPLLGSSLTSWIIWNSVKFWLSSDFSVDYFWKPITKSQVCPVPVSKKVQDVTLSWGEENMGNAHTGINLHWCFLYAIPFGPNPKIQCIQKNHIHYIWIKPLFIKILLLPSMLSLNNTSISCKQQMAKANNLQALFTRSMQWTPRNKYSLLKSGSTHTGGQKPSLNQDWIHLHCMVQPALSIN